MQVFRLSYGPGDARFGSTEVPLYIFEVKPESGDLTTLGYLGEREIPGSSGEIYFLLPHRRSLVMGAYGSIAPLMGYDPARPFDPIVETIGGSSFLTSARHGNPYAFRFPNGDRSWRPWEMVMGPHGKVYVGSIAGYGVPGGALTVVNLGASYGSVRVAGMTTEEARAYICDLLRAH